MLASSNGHKDIVQLLIGKGAILDVQLEDDWTALMLTSSKGHKDIVQLLIDNGAILDVQKKDGYTALMLASSKGHKDIVKLLIDKGAKLDLQEKDGSTALMLASIKGDKDIVQLLTGAETSRINSMGIVTRDCAERKECREIVDLFEKVSYIIHDCYRFSVRCITCVFTHGTFLIVTQKVSRNKMVHRTANNSSKTISPDCTTTLNKGSFRGYKDIPQPLFNKEPLLGTKYYDGTMALLGASRHGQRDESQLHIDKEAETAIINNNGNTARDHAESNGHTEFVDFPNKVDDIF